MTVQLSTLHRPWEPQCTVSHRQTDRQTDRRTDRRQYDAYSRSYCV